MKALGLFVVVFGGLAFACEKNDPPTGAGDGDLGGDGDQSGDGGSLGDGDGDGDLGTGGRPGSGGSAANSGGHGGSANCTVFGPDSPWNQDISALPVHANSEAIVSSIGDEAHMHPDFGTVWDGAPIGIPYIEVDASVSLQDINYTDYGDESDRGPFPIPLDAPIEGGDESEGDRHVLAVDWDACMLYELYHAFPMSGGWDAASGAAFDLSSDEDHPEGCTSADAAGLPIFPGLVRYDEVVEEGAILHALRFTVQNSRRAYVYPARHFASDQTDTDLPPMGMRFRMKHEYDCSSYSSEVQVICAALKTYGMILADNGSNWYLSGAPDSRWDDDALGDLKDIVGAAFEAVDTGDPVKTQAPDCSISR